MNRKLLQLSVITVLLTCSQIFAQTSQRKKPTSKTIQIESRGGGTMEGELWEIEVPENRLKPGSGSIALAVMKVASPQESVGEPVFFLAGGPGGSSIAAVKQMISNGGQRFFELLGGDIVAIDQRGVGLSRPNLSTDVLYGISPTKPGRPEVDLNRRLQVIKSEADRLRQKGVDLSAYNTRESADDLDEVRQALGYEKIVLWGSSYGTHLAMATIRRHEKHIARALLVGPEGPDHTQKLPFGAQRVLERISKMANEQDKTFKTSMIENLENLLTRLEASPVWGDVDGQPVGLGKSDLQSYIAMKLMSVSNGSDELPAQIRAMTNGDFSAVLKLTYEYRKNDGPRSIMSLAMDSASGISDKRLRQIQLEAQTATLGTRMNSDIVSISKALGIKPLDDQFRSTLKTKIPIQFVVGDLDYRTPVSNAKELMTTMPNASLVVVENCGHSDLPMGLPKLRTIWGKFLKSGKGENATITGPKIRFRSMNSGTAPDDSNDSDFVMTREQMERFEGSYRFDHGATMNIAANDKCLVITIPGKGDFNFWPVSPLQFKPEIDQLPVLEFRMDEQGNAISVTGNGKVARKTGSR